MGKWRFNIGDVIQVNYWGWCYSSYDTFFKLNPKVEKFLGLFKNSVTIGKGIYEVVGIGEHEQEEVEMYVLMNEKKNQVFVWGVPYGRYDRGDRIHIGDKAVLIRSAVNYESLLEIEE